MDLFELFDSEENPQNSQTPQKHLEPRQELINELDIIIQSHGINVPLGVLEDLAAYYDDPPPWSPWVKVKK